MEFLVALATVKVARLALANRHLNIYLSLLLLLHLPLSLSPLPSISAPLHSLLLQSILCHLRTETVPNCLLSYPLCQLTLSSTF